MIGGFRGPGGLGMLALGVGRGRGNDEVVEGGEDLHLRFWCRAVGMA